MMHPGDDTDLWVARIFWLLKDADAPDRLGLGECADPAQLRHRETVALLPFASRLLAQLH